MASIRSRKKLALKKVVSDMAGNWSESTKLRRDEKKNSRFVKLSKEIQHIFIWHSWKREKQNRKKQQLSYFLIAI